MRTLETVVFIGLAAIGFMSVACCALLLTACVFAGKRSARPDPRIEADERAQEQWEGFRAAHVWKQVDQ